MSGLIWEEPPPALRDRRGLHAPPSYAAELRSRPGRWARIRFFSDGTVTVPRSLATTHAWKIRVGRYAWAHPAGSFEAVHRPVDGGWGVWARYVGSEDGTS